MWCQLFKTDARKCDGFVMEMWGYVPFFWSWIWIWCIFLQISDWSKIECQNWMPQINDGLNGPNDNGCTDSKQRPVLPFVLINHSAWAAGIFHWDKRGFWMFILLSRLPRSLFPWYFAAAELSFPIRNLIITSGVRRQNVQNPWFPNWGLSLVYFGYSEVTSHRSWIDKFEIS